MPESTKRPAARRWATPLFAAACLLVASGVAAADCVRDGDRVLLVSTRPVGCTTDATRLAEGVHAAERTDAGWTTGSFDSLIGSLDPTTPVVFYVHGNQIEAGQARQRGLDVYRRLVRSGCDDRPIQFVVFSWCSDKVKGLLRDYRVKAARTRPVGWQLAWVIGRLPANTPVGLLGYSYGARVSSGATHILAGGSLSGLRYEPANDCLGCAKRPVRGVFLAAAYDACWNARGRYHGRALDTIDKLLVTVDRNDPAMKYFKWVPIRDDPPAMGGVGPRGLDREQASRVRIRHVESSVGRSHDLYDYLAAPGLMRDAWRRLTFSDAPLNGIPAGEPTLAAATP